MKSFVTSLPVRGNLFLRLYFAKRKFLPHENISACKKSALICHASPCLAPLGPSWPHLSPLGPTWPTLAQIGPPWPYLAPLGPTEPHLTPLGPFGPTCLHLAPLGPAWPHLNPAWPGLAWPFSFFRYFEVPIEKCSCI